MISNILCIIVLIITHVCYIFEEFSLEILIKSITVHPEIQAVAPLPSLQVLHHHVSSMERLPLTTRGYPLIIETKTFQQLHLIIPRESDCLDVMATIKMFAQPREWRGLRGREEKREEREEKTEGKEREGGRKIKKGRRGREEENKEGVEREKKKEGVERGEVASSPG